MKIFNGGNFQRQTGLYLALTVLIVLLFAITMLALQYGKQNTNQQLAQIAGAPDGLAKIEAALKNFVLIQKRLPCPADPANTAGTEAFTGTTATCSQPGGVVPWGSLGLTFNDALDSWGRRVSYRVYFGATGFTLTDGLNASNCNTSTYLTTFVPVTGAGACAVYHESRYADFLAGKGLSVNDKAVVIGGIAYVLISHGSSGYGSYANDFDASHRAPLPNVTSKEYPNTQVPADNTYWKLDASASIITPDSATHFDDVVVYKTASELLDDTKLSGRDWGTVLVDKAFSAPTVTTGGVVTLTITLTNTAQLPVKLALPLVDNFPANLQIAPTPAASTTCGGGAVTAVAGASSVSLAAGATVPARINATLGTCTVTVNVTPTQPATGASINYSNTIAQYAFEATPNLGAATPPPTDAATVRNMAASPTRILTATAPPPIVTPSAGPGGTISPSTPQAVALNSTAVFTVTPNAGNTATVGGTCGGTLVGNTYTTNPINSNCTVVATFLLTVTPSAGANGTISPSTPQSVSLNGTVAFTVTPNSGYTATVGGTCGGSLVGTTYTTNPVATSCTVAATFVSTTPLSQSLTSAALTAGGVAQSGGCVVANPFTLGGLTVTAFASYASPSVAVTSAGIGLATNGCSNANVIGLDSNNERLRFNPGSSAFGYLGIRLTLFRDYGSGFEQATLKFYNAGGTLLTTKTLTACQNLTTVDSIFNIDVGQTFSYADIAAINTTLNATSSFLVGSVAFCSAAPASACVPAAGAKPTVNCP